MAQMKPIEPPDAHCLSAAIGWLELGNPGEAKAELALISTAGQTHPDVLEARWLVCAEQKAWAEALEAARVLTEAAPNRASGWLHLAYALRRLRYKLEYSAVGFQLLPAEFSLSELQHTYEIVLGESLDKRNFRRRMLQSGIIETTAHLRTGEGRPARLYRYRADAVAEIKARRLFP